MPRHCVRISHKGQLLSPPTQCLPTLMSPLCPQAKAQKKHPGRQLPLVIMTSDDTHARTQHLLEEWLYFGADPKQITLLKQASGPPVVPASLPVQQCVPP